MTYTNKFVRILDTTATNPLWDGEEVYMLVTTPPKITGNALTSFTPKTMQDTSLTDADSSNYLNNFIRRKAEVTYGGFNNQALSVTAIYNDTQTGSLTSINGTNRKIFTPSKLMEMVLKPRTFYLKDEVLLGDDNLLSSAEGDVPAIYSSNGMPIILNTWNIGTSRDGKKITMAMTFIEDKGE